MFSSPDKTPGFDHRLAEILAHPVRSGFLKLLAERSPLIATDALNHLQNEDLLLSMVTYHVAVLHRFGLVEAVGLPDPQRGLAFRTTPAGEVALVALGYPPGESRD
jgi:hypothetical protein